MASPPTGESRQSARKFSDHIQANKILNWVDKINGHQVDETSEQRSPLVKQSSQVVVDIPASEDTCFKAAQLITETLLMLFAASLLVVAVIVIFSRKTPAFMDSFEQVPKFLFILCCITATCSFASWIWSRCRRKLGKHEHHQASETKGEAESTKQVVAKETSARVANTNQRLAIVTSIDHLDAHPVPAKSPSQAHNVNEPRPRGTMSLSETTIDEEED